MEQSRKAIDDNSVPSFVPPEVQKKHQDRMLRQLFKEQKEAEDEYSSDDDMTSCIVSSKRALDNVFRTHGRLPPKNDQPLVFFRRANHYVPRHHLF